MFCHIIDNWRGRPLIGRKAAVELIAVTRAAKGPVLYAELDETTYQTGKPVTDDQMRTLAL